MFKKKLIFKISSLHQAQVCGLVLRQAMHRMHLALHKRTLLKDGLWSSHYTNNKGGTFLRLQIKGRCKPQITL